MERFTRLPVLAILVLCVATVSAEEPLVLWTDQPDMAIIAEIYNASHESGVTLRFHDELASALILEAPEADLVVGTYLNTSGTISKFSSLQSLLGTLDELPFPALTATAEIEAEAVLIPLAFGLPSVAVNPNASVRLAPVTITPAEIEENAGKYNRYSQNGDPRRLAFVPRLNPASEYVLLRVFGMEFLPGTNESDVRWDDQRFATGIESFFSWASRISGSRDAEYRFVERYMYDLIPRQFERNRIAFAYLPSNEVLRWNDEWTFDYRWFANSDRKVPVLEDIVWAGIPTTARRARQSEKFLRWYLTPSTQELIVRIKIERRLERFGLFGRFSSLASVNLSVLAALYPDLRGRFLSWDQYIVPPRLPRYWNEAIQGVLLPLLQQTNIDAEGISEELGSRFAQWYLQRGD